MNTKVLSTFVSIATLVFSAVFFVGCENNGPYSKNESPTPHKTLRPPLSEGDSETTTGESKQNQLEFNGTIKEIVESRLWIKTDDNIEHEFLVTPETKVMMDEAVVGLQGLTTGTQIHVVATVNEDLMIATVIHAKSLTTAKTPSVDVKPSEADDEQTAEEIRIDGTIESIIESNLTVIDEAGTRHVVSIADDTKITLDDEEAAFGNLIANQAVVIRAKAGAQSKTATRVDARRIK